MSSFLQLLRENRNYRYTWMGQVVSEVGDHFNNIAVFSLAVKYRDGGMVVTGVFIARALAVILAGPIAGVLLDRWDRKRVMIASDLVRAAVALSFIYTLQNPSSTLLYVLSALLMVASPFFTSGRAAILPSITTKEQLHTANSLTQTTQWSTLTLGAMSGGLSVAQFGYEWAFFLNAMSFLFSAWSISLLRLPGASFRASRKALTENDVLRPWHEYVEGLRYLKSHPLILGIAVINFGWASGGGAAQVLFSLFGEKVFHRGAAGIGILWGCAGAGLLAGGFLAHWLGHKLSFESYKRTIVACYLVHGCSYIAFSQMKQFSLALLFMAISRCAVAVSSVLNFSQLLRHVSDGYRGRVFSTLETVTWGVMMVSMMAAGLASRSYDVRTIGAVSGVLSSLTAFYWLFLDLAGRLPEPALEGVAPEEVEVHEPNL
ncbi:MAG: MFS transporter [Bryobacteraceae bacterium]|nr:MFS transporter [Bryobacteraceae bacterium]MDW8379684.1 MFS transporter [Bryobacterales bacterium]